MKGTKGSQKELNGSQHLGAKTFRPLEQSIRETCPQSSRTLIIEEMLRLSHKREPEVFHWKPGIGPIYLKDANKPFAQTNKKDQKI